MVPARCGTVVIRSLVFAHNGNYLGILELVSKYPYVSLPYSTRILHGTTAEVSKSSFVWRIGL